MEIPIPIIVPEVEAAPSAAPPSRVDLNTADAVVLKRIPSIGPVLAERILAYREERGPFLAVEELMAVPGIGEKVFVGLSEHVMVSFPSPEPLAGAPETGDPALALPPLEEPRPSADAVAAPEAPPLREAEAAPAIPEAAGEAPSVPLPAVLAAALERAPSAPRPSSSTLLPEPPPAVSRPEPSPAPAPAAAHEPRTAKKSAWGWLAWVAAVFAGSILGMVFSLLVLNGINGTLNMDYHPAIIDLRNQTTDLGARQETLQTEVSGLRQRLDRLEGLTARMDQAEAAVEGLRDEVETLDAETAALQAVAEILAQQIADIETRTAKAETFFQRLQVLLSELFGGEELTPQTPIEPEVQP